MPVGTTNPTNILLNSQVLNCCDGLSKSTNSAGDTNDDNCNKIEPFECELQVDTNSEKKQDWSFTLYDFDGKGKITKEELGNLFQALYDAVGSSIRLPLNGTKKLKLRLSIGHDHSHLDTAFKDQSPPLVKKKAKLKNTSRLTDWKEMSLQTGAGGGSEIGMVDPKMCTKLNNLDASPRAKPSTVSKMDNQLMTSTTPGIGHRLMLSCREQKKLTEMVHENMVRNHVRQQTGRKHHYSTHRHHHHHREARRHRGTRKQGDENRKPREKERTYYLDLGSIERSAPANAVSLPYGAGVPTATSTTTATVTTSVMTFARPTVINIVPSSSPPPPPPPPPPPTASGSTAYCNEIGMAADDDDDDDDDDNNGVGVGVGGGGGFRPEVVENGSHRKYDNTWRETGPEEPVAGLTTASGQQDHQQQQHHHHPHHHHHHHHRRRHHPHRNGGDGSHVKCKHCNEKCAPVNIETLKASMSGAAESENTHKILNRRHRHSHNTSTNGNNNNNNNNNNINNCDEIISNNDNNTKINNNDNIEKDISHKDTNRELVLTSGNSFSKQDNPPPPTTNKCYNSATNLKSGLDCVCSRCQKMSCRLRVNYAWQLKSENPNILRQQNAIAPTDGQETDTRLSTLTAAAAITTTTTTTTAAAAATPANSQCDKKTTDRSSKRTSEERHKKHSEGHHHAQAAGRTRSQDRASQPAPAVGAASVSSTVPAVASKMTSTGGTSGAVAERKSLRTHHKMDTAPQQTTGRHRAHCQTTHVPEKLAGASASALLPPPVSPPPPAPTPTIGVASTTNNTTAATPTASTNTLQQQQQQQQHHQQQHPHHHHHHHHHLRRRNQTIRNMEFNEAMQQVADWIDREHNPQQKEQPAHSHHGSVNAEHYVHVQRHEHHHVHEYHHHHHYHHYYQT